MYLVAGLCDGEVIIHLQDPSFQVLHVAYGIWKGVVLFLLSCLADSVDIFVVVVMDWHCKHASTGVVQVVAEVLLQRLPVPAVVLTNIGPSVAVGIVLGELGGSFPAWQVVLQFLQIVVRISGSGIP